MSPDSIITFYRQHPNAKLTADHTQRSGHYYGHGTVHVYYKGEHTFSFTYDGDKITVTHGTLIGIKTLTHLFIENEINALQALLP